jgi:hypothetical protein
MIHTRIDFFEYTTRRPVPELAGAAGYGEGGGATVVGGGGSVGGGRVVTTCTAVPRVAGTIVLVGGSVVVVVVVEELSTVSVVDVASVVEVVSPTALAGAPDGQTPVIAVAATTQIPINNRRMRARVPKDDRV